MTRHPSLFTLILLGTAGLIAPQASAQQEPPPAPAPAAQVPTMQEAGALLGAQDWQAASVAYAKIVIAQPNNGQAWQLLGYSLHANGDLDRALRVHMKAAIFPNVRPIALYNVACVHALQGRTDQAFEYLDQAIAAGFNDPAQFAGDSDLNSLHADARWAQLSRVLAGEVEIVEEEIVEEPIIQDIEIVEDAVQRDLGTAIKLADLAPESRFDFWVGEWDVYYEGQKVTEWTVVKELNGKLIRQSCPEYMTIANFEPTTKKWHMSWVSNEGHHDVLIGGLEGKNKMIMHQKVVRDAPGTVGRWIMKQVHSDYFLADWQLSADKGKSWETHSTMELWRKSKGQAVSASAEAPRADRYDFLVGEFNVEFKVMLPDQTWTHGKGTASARRGDDGTVIETQKLVQDDGTIWEGVTKRSSNQGGQYAVNWTSMDGTISVDSKSVREGKKVVEISVGEDEHGSFRDKLYFTDISQEGYSVWLDRVYTDSGTTIEGLYRASYVRK
jgi:tetratricopeptide (TPR) repeat protein